MNLALPCAAAQLVSQLEALRQPGSAKRVPFDSNPPEVINSFCAKQS